MFKCGLCGGVSQPRQKAVHVVLERQVITQPDTGKPGTAIVREVLAHEECAGLEATAQMAANTASALRGGAA